jgi:hypothetical protein
VFKQYYLAFLALSLLFGGCENPTYPPPEEPKKIFKEVLEGETYWGFKVVYLDTSKDIISLEWEGIRSDTFQVWNYFVSDQPKKDGRRFSTLLLKGRTPNNFFAGGGASSIFIDRFTFNADSTVKDWHQQAISLDGDSLIIGTVNPGWLSYNENHSRMKDDLGNKVPLSGIYCEVPYP